MKKIQTEEIQVSERKNVMKLYEDCILCPRNCHVNRAEGKTGFCGMDSEIRAARAALHMWEEPCISGKKGSGAVFFTGCGFDAVSARTVRSPLEKAVLESVP